jgi:hypothetical protein
MPRKLKIPKKIAGVKLPKQARKTANKAIKMGASPVVRELAVAAIGAAGSKAAGERKGDRTQAQDFGGRAHAQIDLNQVGEAFRAAAIDGLRRFLEGFEEGLRDLNARAEAAGEKGRSAASSRPGAGRD